MPRYCRSCILPDSRPGVALDATGQCSGCRQAESKAAIDWDERLGEFRSLADWAKGRERPWDCVIPVSGGKDSYWQVITCLEHGLRPLCMTYAYPGRNDHGGRNLRRLIEVGVDHIEVRMNPRVLRALTEKSFRATAISGLVTHMAIYSYPLRLAATYGIPLVVYGENSAFEYGSEDERLIGSRVDRAWLKKFGVTAGTTAFDWVDEEIGEKDLALLSAPSDLELESSEVRAVFLGHYVCWDPQNSLRVAQKHGFEPHPSGARVGHYDFVNIDDDMIGVHHHPKWHKFGITRTWDTLSMEIRAGRMTRDDAIRHLRECGDETPEQDIEAFCQYLGFEVAEYYRIVEGFRDRKLWSRKDGRWVIEDFLISDFPWPADRVLVSP